MSASTDSPERRYGGKSAPERRAERRERLLDAGLELFGTRGYGATTIEAICGEAHLNPRYFYAEFKTRETLLQAVYDRHVYAVYEIVMRALAEAPPEPRARLEASLHAFIDGTLADPRAARINYFEMVGVSHELETHRREVLRGYGAMVVQQIEELTRGRPARGLNLQLTAMALVSATDGLITDWMMDPTRASHDEIVATVVEIFTTVAG
jgi:AcrR family transcriptional regulator